MGRFRPPQRRAPNNITRSERRLREELDQLWRVERPKVTRLSPKPRQGDRSENADTPMASAA